MQEVHKNVFVASHFRGITVSAILTDEGYVLIDTPPLPEDARRWKEMLMDQHEAPIRALVLCDAHNERLPGAFYMQPDVIVAHQATYDYLRALPATYINTIAANLTRTSYEQSEMAEGKILLPVILFDKKLELHFGNVSLELEHRPGPMNGSIWVKYPAVRMLFAGDLVVVGTVPFLNSACSKDWLDALEELNQATFAADIIVPGHGNITVKKAIEPVVQYLNTAREQVSQLYARGSSLSDIGRLVNDLINYFPPPLESELMAVQQRVRMGLQSIYNEFRQEAEQGR